TLESGKLLACPSWPFRTTRDWADLHAPRSFEIEEQNVGPAVSLEFDRSLAVDTGAVALAQLVAVEAHDSARDMEPAAPAIRKLISELLIVGEFASKDGDVLV